jgi:site-specific recombinase XerD
MQNDLDPLDPKTAVDLYLKDKRAEYAETTIRSQESRLNKFLQWCEQENIDNLNHITGRQLKAFKIWRRNDGDLAPASLKGQLATLRVFIRWCESIEAVPQDLWVKIQLPLLSPEDSARDTELNAKDASAMIEYLEKYEYASLPHVTLSLLWHTMMRTGSARALDVDDYYREEQYLTVKHRPDTGTQLKNQERGERLVALSEPICSLLNDWIDEQRPTMTDEYGREPLLATSQGRISPGTVRKYAYSYTRPCLYGACPHDEDVEDCEAANERDEASRCPSSVSSHPMRRGSITHWLREDVPKEIVGDRADVSMDILDAHYDNRTERERMEQRRRFLDEF